MTLDEFRQDLALRLGRTVDSLLTRDGEIPQDLSDLYQPSPAGFAGRLICRDGSRFSWDLWLEDEQTWNFNCQPLRD